MAQVLDTMVLSPLNDRWRWTLNGNGSFSVSSARKEIDKHLLVMSSSPTRWSMILHIKVNVFILRMFLDKLSTRSNLSAISMDIHCVLCPVCDSEVESRNHLFFGCSLVSELHHLIGRWWSIHIPEFSDLVSWESWFKGLRLTSLHKLVLEATFFSLWWHVWKFRMIVFLRWCSLINACFLTTLLLKHYFR
ncbi:hypothetical protein CTI12_AA307980 [Artemisia annua]|uniref:Reverse transcriptase zinc-binding domain-containing protein n=1 Tax=Artemisia annua TaxID=35608 RepID=A0A2U1N517_ARTAN|nr:hypothetical protein CTI12_AA307980 [Artemisia annua]